MVFSSFTGYKDGDNETAPARQQRKIYRNFLVLSDLGPAQRVIGAKHHDKTLLFGFSLRSFLL